MRTDIKKVAVLGAGTMGAQVAAHVAGQGLEVALLDLPSPAPDRSAIARKGLETLRKLKPSPLHLPEHLAAIRAGNFEDDQSLLADADWDTALLVLHGAVNRAILSHALTGGRAFLGGFEQAPGCINVLDVGHDGRWIVRAVNHLAYDPAHVAAPRLTTMEHLWQEYVDSRR